VEAEGRHEMALLEPGEAANTYKANILRYQAGADFLALQAAAPAKLASLTGGLSAEGLVRRPAPDKWSIQELAAHLADDELVGAYRIRMILSFKRSIRTSGHALHGTPVSIQGHPWRGSGS